MTVLERSMEICGAINSFALASLGLKECQAEKLAGLSLQQMLDAVREVEKWNSRTVPDGEAKSLTMVPDDRLTSAVYTMLHYMPDEDDGDEPIINWRDGRLVYALVPIVREVETEE